MPPNQPLRANAPRILALVLILLFGAAASALPLVTRPTPAPPPNAPLTLVSLGDSTLSGEGAGNYEPPTNGTNGNWCHRSPDAEIHHTTLPGVTRTVNLACSGATTAQLRPNAPTHYTEHSQTARLTTLATHNRIVAIVVAIGANDDPHFADVLNNCVRAWADNGSCSAGFTTAWQQRVNRMIPKVVTALHDIRAAMARAHYPPDTYQLVLQSYAAPIGPDVAGGLNGLGGCPFRPSDLTWVRTTGVRLLDTALHHAADLANTRFLDLAGAGLGHEACSGGKNPTKEWFTRLTVAWQDLNDANRVAHILQESFHPNARGQAAFGGCLTEFLTTHDPAAACLAGADGTLHPAAILTDR